MVVLIEAHRLFQEHQQLIEHGGPWAEQQKYCTLAGQGILVPSGGVYLLMARVLRRAQGQ